MLDGGVSQPVEFTGKPGKYAFFCFIADTKGGPPHVVKGMISEVVVQQPGRVGAARAPPQPPQDLAAAPMGTLRA